MSYVFFAGLSCATGAWAFEMPAAGVKSDLHLCIVKSTPEEFTNNRVNSALSDYFESVIEKSSVKDTVGCDMIADIRQDSHHVYGDVYSARSHELLIKVNRPLGGWFGSGAGERADSFARDMLKSFAPGTEGYYRLTAEKKSIPATIQSTESAQADQSRSDRERKVAAAAAKSDVDEPARTGAARPDDFALVIGIEDYQSLPKADFGVRDARTVRKYFEALGIPARNIIALEGPAATGNKVKSYLEEWLPLNVKESSTLFVYYSGHGAPDPKTGQAYLVPWDGDPQFLKSTAYPLNELYSDLAKTKAKHVVVALDACFSGAGGRSVLAKGARPLVTKVDQGVSPDGRITILAAASGDQITGTLDDQGHGMFTYFFLKGLGAGKKSAKELFDYLNPLVQDEARRQNREQTPALLGADTPL